MPGGETMCFLLIRRAGSRLSRCIPCAAGTGGSPTGWRRFSGNTMGCRQAERAVAERRLSAGGLCREPVLPGRRTNRTGHTRSGFVRLGRAYETPSGKSDDALAAAATATAVVAAFAAVIAAEQDNDDDKQKPRTATVPTKQITQTHIRVPPFLVGINSICPHPERVPVVPEPVKREKPPCIRMAGSFYIKGKYREQTAAFIAAGWFFQKNFPGGSGSAASPAGNAGHSG